MRVWEYESMGAWEYRSMGVREYESMRGEPKEWPCVPVPSVNNTAVNSWPGFPPVWGNEKDST